MAYDVPFCVFLSWTFKMVLAIFELNIFSLVLNSSYSIMLYWLKSDLYWFRGWSETKKPRVSNSFDNLISTFQSFIFSINVSSFSSLNKSTWLAELFSKMFFDFKIILGIELNNDCLLLLILSKAPALTKPSSCNLFIFFGFTLFIKFVRSLKSPLFILSSTIFEIASKPTLLIAPKA